MKLSQKIALGFAIAITTGLLLYILGKSDETKKKLSQIADEGYEMANDVLFPGKKIGGRHLRYGPVIPL